MPTEQLYSALFIDFENIYYFLKNSLSEEIDPSDLSVQMVRELRKKLSADMNAQCIVQHAYADFVKIEQNSQEALYLSGIEANYDLGTDHKNAADMKMCIDILKTMYTRPEIGIFVILAGDRDYIPVVKHLKEHGRTVLTVAFQANMSGDLLQIVGDEGFIDAQGLLPPDIRPGVPKKPKIPTVEVQPSPAKTAVVASVVPKRGTAFGPENQITDPDQTDALDILMENYGTKSEVWLSPYLHKLRDELPLLAEYERKGLISGLSERGAIAVEKRHGDMNDYSVVLINWNHPDVRERSIG